jgi:steroid delta-isomerase-like uncharacterized protein
MPTTVSEPSTANEKQLVTRLFDACFNQGRHDILPEFISNDYAGPRGERGPEGFAGPPAGLRTGFPDLHYTIEDIVAENDRVVVRWRWDGTHSGPFRDYPPTGKHVTITGMTIFQFHDGKITRTWTQVDQLGFLQQLGAVPEKIAAPSQSH